MRERFLLGLVEQDSRNLTLPQSIDPFSRSDSLAQVPVALVAWLRCCLQRAPWWAEGHLHLAQLSLRCKDVACAYASTQAVLALQASPSLCGQAGLVLAKCYLWYGHSSKAEEVLERLLRDRPGSLGVIEELAALRMVQGRNQEARKLLSSIPKKDLSVESKSALMFLER